MLQEAKRLYEAGLCVLPAMPKEKRPTTAWKAFQAVRPTPEQIEGMFAEADGLCIVCGKVSGNLEVIDFDFGGELFDSWRSLVPYSILKKLTISRTPSGGFHAAYRVDGEVDGNQKLAVGRRNGVETTLIETRGEGGLVLAAPTTGYTVISGDWSDLPVITQDERDTLLSAARQLNEIHDLPQDNPLGVREGRPGDDFNQRGDITPILQQAGWVKTGESQDGNEYWRRPGKSHGVSATFKDGVFYVFTSSAPPFQPSKGYSRFAVYSLLVHGGDYSASAADLRSRGYGLSVDASEEIDEVEDPRPWSRDPGEIPARLLDFPGFINSLIDVTMSTAPYPNQVLSFCGALAMQSFLAGRKVRDPSDARTNVYLLALANSGTGKEWPRKVNMELLCELGTQESYSDRFASGEGIQDLLAGRKNVLLQTDEIDSVLGSMATSDGRYDSVISTLLSAFTSAASLMPRRLKSGNTASEVIDQPHLVLFGTAIPKHYYAAMSEALLTNGFFARTLVFDGIKRGQGQTPRPVEFPDEVLEAALWWSEFVPEGSGDLYWEHPQPAIVPCSQEAQLLLDDVRDEFDALYAEHQDDPVVTSVIARGIEHTRKLALLYAISENRENPIVTRTAVAKAYELVRFVAFRMLYNAERHAEASAFSKASEKILGVLRRFGGTCSRTQLLRLSHMKASEFNEIITTMMESGTIAVKDLPRSDGKPGKGRIVYTIV